MFNRILYSLKGLHEWYIRYALKEYRLTQKTFSCMLTETMFPVNQEWLFYGFFAAIMLQLRQII